MNVKPLNYIFLYLKKNICTPLDWATPTGPARPDPLSRVAPFKPPSLESPFIQKFSLESIVLDRPIVLIDRRKKHSLVDRNRPSPPYIYN